MTILCVGDSHVKRFGAFIDSQASADVFKIADLPQVNFFGISGGAVTNPRHLRTILAVIDEHRPTCLIVHMGGNDLDSRDNAIDTCVWVDCIFDPDSSSIPHSSYYSDAIYAPRKDKKH